MYVNLTEAGHACGGGVSEWFSYKDMATAEIDGVRRDMTLIRHNNHLK